MYTESHKATELKLNTSKKALTILRHLPQQLSHMTQLVVIIDFS